MSAWRKKVTLFIFAVLMIVNSMGGVLAQNEAGSGLIISPTRSELEILPGSSSTIKVTLSNVSGVDITAKAEINDFDSDNETGQPRILGSGSDSKAAVSIRKFLSGVGDIDLEKDEKKDFDIGVNVPPDATGGAYYGILRYSAVPKNQSDIDGEGRVALTASVGTLILLTVPGDIREQIQIESMQVRNDGSPSSFFTKLPNEVAVAIKNNGNGFSQPFGRISVAKAGGGEIYSYELNNTDPKSNILPASTRTFVDKIENITSPGRYTVTANISHGSGGEILPYSVSFWYVPVWLLIAILVGLLLIVFGAVVIYRKRFRRSRKGKKRRN